MLEDYDRIAKLGDGAQGKVFHVRHKKTGREYALKLIRCRDQAQANLALKEIKVLIQLRHPGIVSYIDFFLDFDSRRPNEILVCLVMELCLGNDMEGLVKEEVNNFMRTGKNGTTEATALSWITQAAEALGYLHARGYLHRDIKPTNIFFASSGSPPPSTTAASGASTTTVRDGSPSPSQPSRIKLGDFGLATSMGVDLLNSMVGTPLYIAPELLLKKKYDFKVDVWGLGVVILEVLTLQERPINSEVLESEKSVDAVVKDIRRMGYSSGLANLVRDMLQKDPAKRPSPIEIVERVNSLSAVAGRRSASTGGYSANTTPASSRPSSASSQDPDTQGQMQSSHRRPSALQTVSIEVLKHSPTHWDNVDTPAFAATMSTGNFGEDIPAGSCNNNMSPTSTTAQAGSVITCQMCEEKVASMMCEDCDNEHYCTECDALRHKNVKRAAHRRMPIAASKPPTPTQSLPPTTATLQSQLMELMKPVTVTIPSQAPNLSSALQLLRTLRKERNKQLADCRKQLADSSMCSDAGVDISSMAADPPTTSTLDCIIVGCSIKEDKPIYIDTPVEITSITTAPTGAGTSGATSSKIIGGATGLLADDDGGGLSSSTSVAQTIEVNAKEGLILLCKEQETDSNYQQTGHIHNINIVQRWDGDATPPSSSSSALASGGGERAPSASSSSGMRFAAVDVRGGTWLIEKCRISSQGGQGVILDGVDCFATIRDCAILQTKGAGIYAAACASGGTIQRNRIVGCGSGILVRGSRTGRTLTIQSNHILQSSETGVFCHEASPTLTDNTISESGACGIVLKGKDCNPSLKSNTISHSKHAGIFVCDGASGEIQSNFINSSGKSGIMLKAASNPLVGGNRIQQGAETGIYISEKSLGRYEKNHVLDNGNAGLLVTTGAVPVVISNIISGNRYEGIWVSALGSGRYEKNDLRRNRKGSKDVEQGCSVVFNDNIE